MTVVILLIIGVALIIVNIKAIKKENQSFEAKFDSAGANANKYDIEIAKLRKEFGETIFELQNEIENLKEKISTYEKVDDSTKKNDLNDDNINIENKLDVLIKDDALEGDNTSKPESDKVNDIRKLVKEGYSVDEISQKLKVGKGEVLLIQKLYIK